MKPHRCNRANYRRRAWTLTIVGLFLLWGGVWTGMASDAGVSVYPFPESLPVEYISTDFQVTVNGVQLPIYHGGDNFWGHGVSYGYFDMTVPVEVRVEAAFDFEDSALVPRSLNLEGTTVDGVTTFTIDQPSNITLVFDGDYQGPALHLFAQSPETDVPNRNDANVIYFEPGYYDLISEGTEPIVLKSSETLYLAPGAVVRGRVRSNSASDVAVTGRGVLLNDVVADDVHGNITLAYGFVNDAVIDGIIVNNMTPHWTSSIHGSESVTVSNYKGISPTFASSDGFTLNSSHDITLDGVFIRSADDGIAIKGLSDAKHPAFALPIYNIHVKNAQLWTDANNAMGIGAETMASRFSNITFENIDVLYNFDDPNHPDVLPDRSAINIFALHGTEFRDITFKQIRVEKAKRLINAHMDTLFYFGALSGDWSWPGGMTGLTYEDITSYSDGSNEIKLWGWDEAHVVSDVTFENVVINGDRLIDFNDPRWTINPHVYDVRIVNGGDVVAHNPSEDDIPDVFDAAADVRDFQGNNGWYYRTWDAETGKRDMAWNPDGRQHWRGPNDWDAMWSWGPDTLYLHPDNNVVMVEWEAPKDGVVRITGRVRKSDTDGGDGVDVAVWHNDERLWPADEAWQTVAFNNPLGYSHDVTAPVARGDTISFRVDQRETSAHDSTMWNPVITYIE